MLKNDWSELKRGDWCFINGMDYIAIQFGEDHFRESVILPLNPIINKTFWNWNGNMECPTLTPSILVWGNGKDKPATWHGYLTDGKLIVV